MKNFQNKTKIVRVSKIIRNILFAGLIVGILCLAMGVFNMVLFCVRPADVRASAYYLESGLIVGAGLVFIVNLCLFRFFTRLKDGYLFDAKTVGNLAAAGKWCVALWCFEFVYYMVGNRALNITNAWDFSSLLVGVTLVFVAWLLKEAQELQEEQSLTV